MLAGEVPEKVNEVWGFAVPTLNGGRRKWPEALRAMAVDRIAAGEGIREIAEEIGANKSLVALWVKNAKHIAQHEDTSPAFFEVVPPSAVISSDGHMMLWGEVVDHPLLGTASITTSQLIAIDPEVGWARTPRQGGIGSAGPLTRSQRNWWNC